MEEKYMNAVPENYWLRNNTNNSCGLPRPDALHIFRYAFGVFRLPFATYEVNIRKKR